ncbi:unnamed protein product, partial [marine sediment metagenome]
MINTIITAVGFLVTGIIITLIFSFIRSKILKRATKQALNYSLGKEIKNTKKVIGNIAKEHREKTFKHWNNPKETNAKVGNKLNKNGEEVFQIKKFFIGLNPFNLKIWAKSIVFLFRYILVFLVIFGVVYNYGKWKGRGDTPISIEIIGSQKQWELKIPKTAKRLYHPENSKQLYWVGRSGKKTPVKV